MATYDDKMPTATSDIEKHGEPNYTSGQEHRRSSVGGRLRGSLSVQQVPDGSVEGQIFSMNAVDPALDKKMRLVNEVDSSSSARTRLD